MKDIYIYIYWCGTHKWVTLNGSTIGGGYVAMWWHIAGTWVTRWPSVKNMRYMWTEGI